jgi:uncharacterized HAD superfamily protein
MAYSPYITRERPDQWRVRADVGVTALYAYLLFTIEPIKQTPHADFVWHLLGYVYVFMAYVASGYLRRLTYGPRASRIRTLLAFLAAYLGLVVAYRIVWVMWAASDPQRAYRLNVGALTCALGLMWLFRHRAQLRVDARRRTEGLTVGVDVDGVLADQVTGVLPKIQSAFRLALSYGDITQWRLPVGDSDIATEIEKAQRDHKYVRSMRVHKGAVELLRHLRVENTVVVITARKTHAHSWTKRWLRREALRFDEFLAGEEAKKSVHRTDVLIDDYLGNVLEYLQNAAGVSVLVDQPWNREREALTPYLNEKRAFVASSLEELIELWPQISEQAHLRRDRR